MSESTRDLLEQLAKVLLRSWIFGMVVLLIWFGLYMSGVYHHGFHESTFGLSQHETNVVHYCGMGLMKLTLFVVFFCPWLACKSVLR